jgi:REP-associated tyrosine transposase
MPKWYDCFLKGTVKILKGAVSKDHIHVIIEYRSSMSISNFVKRVKGRTSKLPQQESPESGKKYFG